MRIIVLPAGRCRFLEENESGYEDNRPTCRAVWVFRRKRKRFAVSKEQNMAVYGMYDPL